jgi:YebC/PmpR family DNA-binding regulatory protein
MAGHSHAKNVQHIKAAADAKKGKLWSKLSRAITVAARTGGGDPVANVRLRFAIDTARKVSMPKDTIERAVKKGTGELEGEAYEELTYEGFAPGGVAVLVEIVTDNRARSSGEVRKVFEKGGGTMGSPGCVAYLFERKGVILVPAGSVDEDTLLGVALEAGADDVKKVGDDFEILCDPTVFAEVKTAVEKHGLTPTHASISHIGKVPVDADTETGQKVLRLLDALDDHDDVQNVYSNLHVTQAMMA